MRAHTVQVAVPIPIDQLFTYRIPEKFSEFALPGCRVLVPFDRKRITGYVTHHVPKPFEDALEIADLLDYWPIFSKDLLHLADWVAEYYMAPLGMVLQSMLPPGMQRGSERIITLKQTVGEFEIANLRKSKPVQSKILKALFVYRSLSLKALSKKIGSTAISKNLEELKRLGIIEEKEVLEDASVKIKFEKIVHLASHLVDEPERFEESLKMLEKRSVKQAAMLQYLKTVAPDGVVQSVALQEIASSREALKALAKKGLVRITERERIRSPFDRAPETKPNLTLNPDQQRCVNTVVRAVQAGAFHTFLLHGITGSGKTQVYIEAIRETVALGKSAIVLVPEISLTPQTVAVFRSWFGPLVTIQHSAMSHGERFDAWRKIRSGELKIVIGARSAVFAPVENLGLVVVDEEHETTYKQNDLTPKYQARDCAIVRASQSKAVVILGSATPSIESFFNAEDGKYTLLTLDRRIGNIPLPPVELVDMRKQIEVHTENWQPVLSKPLRDRMLQSLKSREQIILFQNRRGYSNALECYSCGHSAECPHCSIHLTFHRFKLRLKCHYCGYTLPAYRTCPSCGESNLLSQGIGTQRVEEQIDRLFPSATYTRMDLDTTSRKGSHTDILEQFKSGGTQILIGTQMVTKGLDFENVTLVGVISADTNLLFPDFRSSERTFQLLTQVAGRAGRKEKSGKVVVQTYRPQHYAIQHARTHDFSGFYREEITFRKEARYPPFSRLILVQFRALDENLAIEHSGFFSDIFREQLQKNTLSAHCSVLGPSPAPILKIRNQFRWHVLLKTLKSADRSGSLTRALLRNSLKLYSEKHRNNRVQFNIDVDPINLL